MELTGNTELPVRNVKTLSRSSAFLLGLGAVAPMRVYEEAGRLPQLPLAFQPETVNRLVERAQHDVKQFDRFEPELILIAFGNGGFNGSIGLPDRPSKIGEVDEAVAAKPGGYSGS